MSQKSRRETHHGVNGAVHITISEDFQVVIRMDANPADKVSDLLGDSKGDLRGIIESLTIKEAELNLTL